MDHFWLHCGSPNRSKIASNFNLLLGPLLGRFGTQNEPKIAPKSTPRGSRDALGARWPLEAVFGALLGSFLDPPEPRKSCSRVSGSMIFTKSAFRAGSQKSTPKLAQNRPQNGPQRAPDDPKCRPDALLDLRSNFRIDFHDF